MYEKSLDQFADIFFSVSELFLNSMLIFIPEIKHFEDWNSLTLEVKYWFKMSASWCYMRKFYTDFSIKLYKPFTVRSSICRYTSCRLCYTDNSNKVSMFCVHWTCDCNAKVSFSYCSRQVDAVKRCYCKIWVYLQVCSLQSENKLRATVPYLLKSYNFGCT